MTGQTKPGRDALGNFCFTLHLLILAVIVLGWLAPWRGFLSFYLIFIPATVLHWKFNHDACILNNIESWLRYRRWRAPDRNPEEGAWLRTLVGSWTGIALSRRVMDIIIYAAMNLFWFLALGHLLLFQGS
jgi:hypothetical protein